MHQSQPPSVPRGVKTWGPERRCAFLGLQGRYNVQSLEEEHRGDGSINGTLAHEKQLPSL